VHTRDRFWLIILAVLFSCGLAASWHRWANPVIDSGREMNQPLRIDQRETLYSEVGHIYGPFSPWFHAALYRAFGPTLNVLYADGILSAIVILALVYGLARRIMDPPAAATTTLLVMWLCAFKASGNYIFPYAYSALHGTLFGLITLALCAAALERASVPRFAVAGLAAGVTILAKTEMGLAALCAGVAAAVLAGSKDPASDEKDPAVQYASIFLAAAATLSGAVYALIVAHVGWRTLVFDNWLLVYNLPAPLAYFNRGISGFDRPLASFLGMLIATAKLAIIAAIVGSISVLTVAPRSSASRARIVLVAALAAGAVLSLTTGLDWDRGPFLAMPVGLGVLLMLRGRVISLDPAADTTRVRIVMLYSVFALAQLARMVLHVRSGGAYGSFLLPVSIVVFTYLWVGPFAGSIPDPAARRRAASLALGLLLATALGTAVVLGYRYRRSNTVEISTARGTLFAPPDVARAWNEALAYIDAHTRLGDPIVVLPEGTSLTFLSGRRNPLREEIVTPGFLDRAGEARAIQQIDAAEPPLILIVNRPTREFGAEAFGRDYDRDLMRWITGRYRPCAAFPSDSAGLEVGDVRFFVHAYCRATIYGSNIWRRRQSISMGTSTGS
jgi:hypothetical protein